MCAVYPRIDMGLVPSHNDLKPENVLFDGDRVWLVDWQAAFTNDRYFDLAVVANFVLSNEAEERDYLMYASVFLLLGSAGQPIDRNVEAPRFLDVHRGIRTGEVTLEGNPMRMFMAGSTGSAC